jgi:hypothetical protein
LPIFRESRWSRIRGQGHNVVVRTLCSCYPWALLGPPTSRYKDPPYRSRMVREPRVLLAEMGCMIGDTVNAPDSNRCS